MGTPICGPLKGLNEAIGGGDVDATYLGQRNSTYDPAHLNPIRGDRPPVIVYEEIDRPDVKDYDLESIETVSASSSTKGDKEFPETYRIRGVKWGTPHLTNTCHMDSFLSTWVRRVRQTHNRCSELVVTKDLPGLALLDIADHAIKKGNAIDSYFIKKTWLKAILQSTGEDDLLEGKGLFTIDCRGNCLCSIFQHLKNHSSYSIESKCPCGTFYYRDFFFEIGSDLEQLKYLSDEKNYDKIKSPKCSRCGQKRLVTKIKHDPGNWLMPIYYFGTVTKKNQSPPLSQIPESLKVGGIDFKLASISYSQLVPGIQDMTHQISIHPIRGQFYLYNGLSPMFNKWTEPTYEIEKARLIMFVYFKQVRMQGEGEWR